MGAPGAPRPATPVPQRFNAAEFFVDRHLAEGRAGRPAFRYRGRTLTYRHLAEQVNRAGNALAALGVEMEQRVLIALDDSPAFATVFWGAAKIGAVAVPVNPATRPEEIAFLLEDSRARVAVVEPDVAAAVTAAQLHGPGPRAVVVAGHQAPAGTHSLDALMEKAAADLAPAPTAAEDVLYWGYTSGSTGRPKAAVHLHEDFVAAADLVGVGVFGLEPDDLVL
ncbi:MAG TPA: AMP-binding protein, partial [Candidatus Binatia bacterium]|nr:AMP-binding protein [Candidatus Binatia bacterium]